ncbi:MAG: ABC transporter permease [Chloroflexi bacterium]|nr:ABC transporter permease [Chloroflexota bacterium]
MRAYIARRLLLFIPTLLGVSTLIFFLIRVVPGDVAALIVAGPGGEVGQAEQATLQAVREKLGLDRALYVQYLDWLWGVVRLDLGKSFTAEQSIISIIGERLPVTVELAVLASVFTLTIAVPAGVLAAVYRSTWIDYVVRTWSIAGVAMPTFWIGLLIIVALLWLFKWFPPLGFARLDKDPLTNLQQIVWPALALGYYHVAVVARMTRGSMLEVIRQDYVRTARAKGLTDFLVIARHAVRNALLPVVTIMGLQLGVMMGGAVIMETIFLLPGLGRTLILSITFRDYPLLQGIVVFLSVSYLTINLLVDLLYAWLDPRIRYA